MMYYYLNVQFQGQRVNHEIPRLWWNPKIQWCVKTSLSPSKLMQFLMLKTCVRQVPGFILGRVLLLMVFLSPSRRRASKSTTTHTDNYNGVRQESFAWQLRQRPLYFENNAQDDQKNNICGCTRYPPFFTSYIR